MPSGKPAGVRCVQLDDQHHCRIFASEERPAVCCNFPPHPDVCGSSRAEARQLLRRWEVLTA